MTKPQITLDTPIGPDIDLETEDIYLPSGTRLTNSIAEEIVAEVRNTAGRPSLTGPGTQSPVVHLRVPQDLNNRLTKEADRTGKSRSDIVREALVARLVG